MRYRELFDEREFTALYVADVLSISGGYLARIAVAALVYSETGSTAATAIAFAVSYAPYVFSPWLSTLADMFPRRQLLIWCDVARALCVLAILIPGLPLIAMVGLLFAEAGFRVPWGASRLALLSDILTDERFPAGNALVSSTRQALQVAGFALGGAVVALAGPRPTIAINVVTFILSALIIMYGVRSRPAPWQTATAAPSVDGDLQRPSPWAGTREGLQVVRETPGMLRLFVLLAIGPAVVVITEGLAVPFADELGGGVTLAGLIMAAPPTGTVVGLWVFGRLPFERQRQLVLPLALLSAASGLAVGAATVLPGAVIFVLVFLVAAGGCLAYLSAVQAQISVALTSEFKGRVFGLANAVLQLAQGVAIAIAGLVAGLSDVALSLAALAGLATLGVLGVAAGEWREARYPVVG